MLSYGKQVDIF